MFNGIYDVGFCNVYGYVMTYLNLWKIKFGFYLWVQVDIRFNVKISLRKVVTIYYSEGIAITWVNFQIRYTKSMSISCNSIGGIIKLKLKTKNIIKKYRD
jgi:hypothetical protein